jgi:hypothetical protein
MATATVTTAFHAHHHEGLEAYPWEINHRHTDKTTICLVIGRKSKRRRPTLSSKSSKMSKQSHLHIALDWLHARTSSQRGQRSCISTLASISCVRCGCGQQTKLPDRPRQSQHQNWLKLVFSLTRENPIFLLPDKLL